MHYSINTRLHLDLTPKNTKLILVNNRLSNNTLFLVAITMLAFAGNSVLCRLALKGSEIDAASFTSIRLVSGALVLWLLVRNKSQLTLTLSSSSIWPAVSLFVYAAGFSFAYINLSAATGALLLFGAVQFTMIAYGLYSGERLTLIKTLGITLALIGLATILLPQASSPPATSAGLMVLAGIAWGVYSVLGRKVSSPLHTTANSFILAIPMTLVLSLIMMNSATVDSKGAILAIASGAVTSGLGYALWYRVVSQLTATGAASVQLSVPAITAVAGAILIGEPLTLTLILATCAILGGIALVISDKR